METEDSEEAAAPAKIIEIILHEADRAGASDIHVDPGSNEVLVRFRADGLLAVERRVPKALHAGLISRIKILARLRTDLHNMPQDGRLTREFGGGDIRASIMPTHYGEAAVLRILKDKPDFARLETLGVNVIDVARLEAAMARKQGMVLITGPTGSGKTTTLYSLLRLVSPERLVVTIEDPVEYVLPSARQVQVDAAHGLTFAAGLRSILRQDPDVIMVGEIRDAETAHIAIHASLTGHLVLSTLHTNDALSVVVRFLDMGVAPYLIAATLETIVAQRLVRKRCERCRERGSKGCATCRYTGFRGRLAVYEIATMSTALREAVIRGASLAQLQTIAAQENMRTLAMDGMEKSRRGLIDDGEVISAL